jgi:hypothetical protein
MISSGSQYGVRRQRPAGGRAYTLSVLSFFSNESHVLNVIRDLQWFGDPESFRGKILGISPGFVNEKIRKKIRSLLSVKAP